MERGKSDCINKDGKVTFLPAGTVIVFDGATADDFGVITVVEGVLEVVYFDASKALVRMGKFPVLSAEVIKDASVIIGSTSLDVVLSTSDTKSGTNHTHWSEKSCWDG